MPHRTDTGTGVEMTLGKVGHSGSAGEAAPLAPERADKMRELAAWLPRPLRFLGVGSLGLLTDLSVFTAIAAYEHHPLAVRVISLAAATLVTWRLNRALTFDRSGRQQSEEAMRYAAVTAAAQAASYAVFAALVLTVFAWLPQAALVSGAAVGAVIAYNGHRLFAFAPRRAAEAVSTFPLPIASEGSRRA